MDRSWSSRLIAKGKARRKKTASFPASPSTQHGNNMWRGHFYGRGRDQAPMHGLWLRTGNLQGPSSPIETSAGSRGGMQRSSPLPLSCLSPSSSLRDPDVRQLDRGERFYGDLGGVACLAEPAAAGPSAYGRLAPVHLQVPDIQLYRASRNARRADPTAHFSFFLSLPSILPRSFHDARITTTNYSLH